MISTLIEGQSFMLARKFVHSFIHTLTYIRTLRLFDCIVELPWSGSPLGQTRIQPLKDVVNGPSCGTNSNLTADSVWPHVICICKNNCISLLDCLVWVKECRTAKKINSFRLLFCCVLETQGPMPQLDHSDAVEVGSNG